MAVSIAALPSVVPATVISAARTPCLAPVAITSVTIGPGVMINTKVMTRKAANKSQFIGSHSPVAVLDQAARFHVLADGSR